MSATHDQVRPPAEAPTEGLGPRRRDREDPRHHVVIVGGGFGGLEAARYLDDPAFRVTLVDRRNYHLFQPLLYQVATSGLSPGNIAEPLRRITREQRNLHVLLGEVVNIDPTHRRVVLSDRTILAFDSLIVAAGAGNHYFGNDHWARHAPGLKSVEEALHIRRKMLLAFEKAEQEEDPGTRAAWLTFVVVGAGPTGVEMAGAITDVANDILEREFHHIEEMRPRILLVEGLDRVLPAFHPEISRIAKKSLEKLGVEIVLGQLVSDVNEQSVTIGSGDEARTVAARTAIWGAGLKASPLGLRLQDATEAEVDKGGRVKVRPDCTIPGHSNIYVIGDMANYSHTDDGEPLPGLAPVALQQGRYVAETIPRRAAHLETPPFSYVDKGMLATIGRHRAVADFAGQRFGGRPAWLAWLLVHIYFLIGFSNRLLVLFQWAFSYLTFNRSTRLITGDVDIRTPPKQPQDTVFLPRALLEEEEEVAEEAAARSGVGRTPETIDERPEARPS